MCSSELLRNPVAVACSVLRVYVLCFVDLRVDVLCVTLLVLSCAFVVLVC